MSKSSRFDSNCEPDSRLRRFRIGTSFRISSDKPDPASVTNTNVVDLQILDCSRPVRPLALPAEAVLKVTPLVSESVGSIESSWLMPN